MELSRENTKKLLLIKLIHTLIWVFYVFVIGYVLYAGFFDEINVLVCIAIGLVFIEGVVLQLNDGRCPLTPIAGRYTNARSDNFDIFLPKWLARNNKLIFTLIFAVGLAMVTYRLLT